MKKKIIIKKIFLIFTLTIFLYSCDTQVSSEPAEIGFTILQDGQRSTITAGPASASEVWLEYITAHNERDIEKIKSLNADDITVWGPSGEFISGTEDHIAFLENWFENNNPRWAPMWFINNTGENPENNQVNDYVTSGNQLTLNVDGQDIIVYQVNDAAIKDGKVQFFYVYQQQRAVSSEE